MASQATRSGQEMPMYTREVFKVLKQCAADMTTISYGDLAEQVGIHHLKINLPLGYIRDKVCRKHGLPWLSVLAVNADRRRPGDGWLPPKGIEIAEQQDRERLWRGMVLQVYGYDWSKVEIESE